MRQVRFFSSVHAAYSLALLGSVLTGAYPVIAGVAPGTPVKGDAIKNYVQSKRIYLSVPFGGEMPLHYKEDGVVDGSGEAIGLGKFLAPKDQGRWWIDGDRLCQQWQQWYDGKVFCFTLESLPENKLVWRRDDGEEGIARIGN